MALNTISICGRLTRDPESKYTTAGKQVVSFSVAVDRNYKGQDGEYETDFFNCTAWEKTAEFLQTYVKKGRLVTVSGEMRSRHYVEQDTGKKRTVWEIHVNQVSPVGSNPEGKGEEGEREVKARPNSSTPTTKPTAAASSSAPMDIDESDPFADE